MIIAADYPFLDVMWTIFVFFIWVAWFMLLFRVFADIFRRQDISGWGKTGWVVFTIVLPFLGVFVYIITQGREMTERSLERVGAQRAEFDGYVRETARNGGAASEISQAKQLLDSGAITTAEFETLKQKALA